MRGKARLTAISLLSTIGFFGIFSTTISKSPVLPLFVKSMGGSADIVGLIAAISPLAGILFSFPVGLVADRLGKKRLLVAASIVFVTAPALYVFVTDPLWLIPIRFFHGIGTAILGPVASAIILAEYRDSKGEKLGIYSSATLVGRSLAPLVGGSLISLFVPLQGAWNYRIVYAAAFVLSLPVLVLSILMPGDSGGAQRNGNEADGSGVKKLGLRDFGASLRTFLSNRRLLGTALVEMATYFAYGGLETYLPLFLQGKGVPSYEIGLVFSVQILAIALSKPLFGRLSDRMDRRAQVLVGIVVLGASFAAIPLASGAIGATAIGIVFGLGLSFSTVATSTYVSDVAAEENLGASLGALSSIMDIGHSSGPLLIGLVIQASSMPAGFLTGCAVCLASAAFFALAVLRDTAAKKAGGAL
jgi:MFS family permease